MHISRRNVLRHFAAGAATAFLPSLTEAAPGLVSTAESAGSLVRPIRLNRNENAYRPSPKVIAAMQEAALDANRYPDVEAEQLRSRIAALHQVQPDQVVLGCGSTEIMRMAVDALLGRDRKLIAAQPTFDLIGSFAQRVGAEVIGVPLTEYYYHDLDAMLARADSSTGLVYICNPNNSTGSLTPRQKIEAFLRSLPKTTYVLIDEAYHHYVGQSGDYASFIDRPLDDERVIVTRSFSSIYGLAGLRIGYAVAAPAAARLLAPHRLPEGVNIIAARAALAALDDSEYVMAKASQNADERQEFFNNANARMVRVIDSRTNFVMVNAHSPANEVIDHFRKNNITLPQPFPSFAEYIRVSLGTPSEMNEFWRVWDLMPNHGMSH